MTDALTTDLDLAAIRERDALWTANYAHMHSSDGYGPAAADRRKLLGEIERLRRGEFICSRCYLRKPADGEVECEF